MPISARSSVPISRRPKPRRGRISSLRSSSALLALLLWSGSATAQAPLSAIDWLDEMSTVAVVPPGPDAPDTADSADRPDVTVTPLGAPRADATGLLSGATTGLPRNLWGASTTAARHAGALLHTASGRGQSPRRKHSIRAVPARTPRGAAPFRRGRTCAGTGRACRRGA